MTSWGVWNGGLHISFPPELVAFLHKTQETKHPVLAQFFAYPEMSGRETGLDEAEEVAGTDRLRWRAIVALQPLGATLRKARGHNLVASLC